MPQRPFSRDPVFLIPPSLDDWLPAEHPARFVAVWLDELTAADGATLGIDPQPARTGEHRYAPEALLAIWVYGFMVGIRSTRGLAAACRDQVPVRWLSGTQQPDHNTLARFDQRHRGQLRHLCHRSVQTAVHAGLVDFALQAVAGTKIAANAAGDRRLTADQVDALATRGEAAIADLDAQDRATDPSGPPAAPGLARGPRPPRAGAAGPRHGRRQCRTDEGHRHRSRCPPDEKQGHDCAGLQRPGRGRPRTRRCRAPRRAPDRGGRGPHPRR
ncbi:MAG: transposase [Chloroflexota bacterium]|nr:transposase [Chloroflexota bacterium]